MSGTAPSDPLWYISYMQEKLENVQNMIRPLLLLSVFIFILSVTVSTIIVLSGAIFDYSVLFLLVVLFSFVVPPWILGLARKYLTDTLKLFLFFLLYFVITAAMYTCLLFFIIPVIPQVWSYNDFLYLPAIHFFVSFLVYFLTITIIKYRN
ncbi:MAG: hypothetical protein ACI9VM_000334 [Candidatus Azotimanducaceae bacterium]